MAPLGGYAYEKGYRRTMIIAEDYAFPYSQVQGFMSGFCKAGGRVPKKAWVPVGNKDFSSVIASIPEDVDSLLVVRSEERRVGKECVSTCRSRWSPYH